MKKAVALLLALAMGLTFASCGPQEAPASSQVAPGGSSLPAVEEPVSESSPAGPAGSGEGVLVAYFSATGNTEGVASLLAEALGAELFEIVPAQPYTSEDLDYGNDSCRANQEQDDPEARPEIAALPESLDGYGTVFIGYPIWWGTAPRIIQTFVEGCGLEGKRVYTFCTSGGSGVEQSLSDLRAAYPHLDLAVGHRFSAGASQEDVQAWLDTL